MALGMEKRGLVLVLGMMVLLSMRNVQVSNAAVFHIGGSAGWTTIGNIDYQKLSDANTYNVGDILIFKYNPMYHNVMEVTNEAYTSCNASSPITTYTTGNDSIALTTGGHHYFLCGFPSHCQLGQKVNISILVTSSMASTPSPSSSPAPALAPSASAPSSNKAAPVYTSTNLFSKLGFLIFVFFGFYV